jgi:hypothetical protein
VGNEALDVWKCHDQNLRSGSLSQCDALGQVCLGEISVAGMLSLSCVAGNFGKIWSASGERVIQYTE